MHRSNLDSDRTDLQHNEVLSIMSCVRMVLHFIQDLSCTCLKTESSQISNLNNQIVFKEKSFKASSTFLEIGKKCLRKAMTKVT